MSSELETLGLSIKRVQDRHHQAMDAVLKPLGISLVQWNALREIERNPGSALHRLAVLTFNSDQGFGALVARLLKLGFVERHTGDNRALLHTLTETGQRLLASGKLEQRKVLEASFGSLGAEERRLLADLLERMLAAPLPGSR